MSEACKNLKFMLFVKAKKAFSIGEQDSDTKYADYWIHRGDIMICAFQSLPITTKSFR